MRCAIAPDGASVAIGGADGTLRILKTGTFTTLYEVSAGETEVTCLAWSPSGEHLVVCTSESPAVKVVVAGDGYSVQPFYDSPLQLCVYGPGGQLAFGLDDGSVLLSDDADSENQTELTDYGEDLTSVAFSPSGKLVALGYDDTGLFVLHYADGEWTEVFHFSSWQVRLPIFAFRLVLNVA